jgi:low temperature requirement protein LtrA
MSEPIMPGSCPEPDEALIEQRTDQPNMNPWWQPPRLRSHEIDGGNRHPTWLELFFDLVLVAAIGQLSKGLSHDLSLAGLFRFVVLAVPIWWAWTGVAFYSSRFDTNDLSDRIFYCLQMIGVAALAVNVKDGLHGSSAGFAASYAFLRLLLVLQYVLAAIYVQEARELTLRYILGFGMAALCFLASVWVPLPQRFVWWAVGLLLDFGFPIMAGKLHFQVPPHSEHISERYGLFIIVVLGEAVMGVVAGVSAQPHWTLLSGMVGVLGLLITFSLWWIYFDHASTAPARAVKNERRVWLYQTWLYSHLPLMISLSAMGVAIQQLVLSPQALPIAPMVKWLFCLSVAFSLFTIGVVHTTSCYFSDRLLLRIWLPYLLSVGAIIFCAILLPHGIRPYAWVLLLTGICVFNLVIQVFYDRNIYDPPTE